MSANFSPFCPENFQQGCQNWILFVYRNRLKKKFLERTSGIVFIFFAHRAKKILAFYLFFRIRLSELYSTCQKEHFDGKCFLKNHLSFQFFFGLWPHKSSASRQVLFRKAWKKCILRLYSFIFEEKFFKKNICLSFLEKERKSCGFKNGILRVPRNILTKFFWRKCVFLYLFLTLSKQFSTFCRKNGSRDDRTAFYVFTGTVRKLYFPGKNF